jgi:beta-glucosidase
MKRLFIIFLLISSLRSAAQDYKSFPMWDPALPTDQRVNDLVSRLTLEEKVKQMLNSTPEILRLGIPAYDWWNETLHGVARTPYHTTSYPQAIAMAATWDTASIRLMGDYSATEGRAIHNIALARHQEGDRYLGLTYWTPNINIFRDPRWGRGQETYGEDPFLTATMAHAFVDGLQGNDPVYLKAAACAKHFAVHSGPEPTRHADNIDPSTYDLWDTYLPAFRELVVKAKVAGVMCAYNAVNTQPCCANDLLMTDILRRQWGFTGYVTSDCWALDDFFTFHKTHKDAISAAVDALFHSTDVECGNSVYIELINAVKTGLVKESALDASLKRLFTIRYRLGFFDPAGKVKYARIDSSVLESAEHKALALKMARQSIVLLRNEDHTLPLKKSIRKIVVLGPDADNKIAVLGNYNGIPSRIVSVLDGIKEKLGPGTDVVYEKAINFADDTMMAYNKISDLYTYNNISGVKADYFKNENLEGAPFHTRMEKDIDHYWTEGQEPVTGFGAAHYSARYTTEMKADRDQIMNFEIEGDDGYRIMINDHLMADAWLRDHWGAKQFQLTVKKDSSYKIVVEFYQGEGNASISLRSGNYVKTDFRALANRIKDADAIVFVGGISPQLEGEEMQVNVPGFKGGDRNSIMLPAVQTELMKALKQTGKPLVFVMMTGSAIAIPWESEHIPAILNAWYGGQSAGTAVADVLFGDYNPAGRLPVTFYRSDADLEAFSDYDMRNRTYRYFKGTPLYPFGYGLSYTTFQYSSIRSNGPYQTGKNLVVSAMVKNTGKMDGEEVAQLYVSFPGIHAKAPIRALKGFQRIFLQAGEEKKISFTLTPDQLSLVNEKDGKLYQPAGNLTISIGGGQPDTKNKTVSKVISTKISYINH